MLTQVVANRVYDYSHAIGGGGRVLYAVGMALGAGDTVYVLCRSMESIADVPWNQTAFNAKVSKLTIGKVPGDESFVGDFGSYGDGEGELIWPAGICLDSQENVYVSDEWLNRVSIFDKEGNFLSLWGTAGSGDRELNRPSGIAMDQQDNLYVVDSLNHRVQRFTRDGQFLGKWGKRGSHEGELDSPWGITIGNQGYVYVADHMNHRAQKFTAEGEYVATFGDYGTGRGQLNRPSDVAVDPDGDVYVCDWANNRVQVFEPDGRFITSLIGDAQQLAKWQQEEVDANVDVVKARRRAYSLEPEWRFVLPAGVTFDGEHGRLIVADTQRRRIQIYNKLTDYMEPQFNL